MRKQLLTALLALGCMTYAGAEINRLVVEPNAKGAPIPSTMYGLFFEDINYAADGGLYAEKIKNRSFDFPTPLQGWNAFGGSQPDRLSFSTHSGYPYPCPQRYIRRGNGRYRA